jgi:vitamin B12 transporter
VSRAEARLDSLYLQVTAQPLQGIALSAGVRHDDHDVFGGATVFAANGSFTPNGGATQARVSYGEGFKAPSLFQLFSSFGNPLLAPERSQSIEAGITQTLLDGGIEAGATLFRRTTRNQIDFISCFGNTSPICTGRPFGTYDNIRRTRGEGVEIALRLNPTDDLRLSAAYSFIDAKNRDTGLELARRPRDSMNVSLDWQTPFGASVGGTISHTGASFENAANSVRLTGYTLVDLRASMPVTGNLELFGRVENLFDEVYETTFRYGSAGRGAYVGARLRY